MRVSLIGFRQSAGTASAVPVVEAYALQLTDLGSVSSKTVTLTVNIGELALGFYVEDSTRGLNLPSGYADVHGGTIIHDDRTENKTRWIWDILGSGITDQDFTVSSASVSWWPGLLRISGAHATSPIHQQAFTTNQLSDTIVCPAISDTTVNNCLILRLICSFNSAAGNVSYPSGTTGLFKEQIGAGAAGPVEVSLAYEPKETAGSVAASNNWGTWDLSRRVIAGTIAIAPAA